MTVPNVHSLYSGGPLTPWLSPTFVACRLLWMAILTGGVWYLLPFCHSPVIIRNAEHLVLWAFGFLLFFFSFKGVRKIYQLQFGFLKVGCVWNLYLQYTPKDLSWGQLSLTVPQALWITPAIKQGWSKCSYRKDPQATAVLPAQLWFLRQGDP